MGTVDPGFETGNSFALRLPEMNSMAYEAPGRPRLRVDLGRVDRILVVRLSSLGDIVHATPCLRALRGRFPSAEIFVAVERRFADLLRASPWVDGLIEAKTKTPSGGIATGFLEGRAALSHRQPFDLAIDLQGLSRSAGWVYASGARIRAGRGRFRPRWQLASSSDLHRHAIEVCAVVLRDLGIPVDDLRPELTTSAEADRVLHRRLVGLGIEPAEYVVANPFSRWASKAWPAERWAALITWIRSETGRIVVVSGGPGEEAQARSLSERLSAGSAVFLAGCLPLAEALCLYRRAVLVVSGDTGPMHAAAALGTRVVALFGPTLPERTGPYGEEHAVLQALRPPEHHAYRRDPESRFMRALDLETVRAGVARALAAVAHSE